MKMEQSVPKRRHIKFRRARFTQKKSRQSVPKRRYMNIPDPGELLRRKQITCVTWFQNTSFAWVKPQGNRYEGQLLYNRLVYKNPVPLVRFLLVRTAVSILEQFTAVQTRKCEWLLVSKKKRVFCSVGCNVL